MSHIQPNAYIILTCSHTYKHTYTHTYVHVYIHYMDAHSIYTNSYAYSYNLHHPNVEGESSIWRDLLSHTTLAVAQAGREGDPPPLIKTRTHQSSVHSWYNVAHTQCDYVWSVVVKTTMNINTDSIYSGTSLFGV